jgi:hypothetical protein
VFSFVSRPTPKGGLIWRLWEKVGLWVELENIAITADYARKNFTALIVLDRNNLADALARWLQSTGETIVVAPAKSSGTR